MKHLKKLALVLAASAAVAIAAPAPAPAATATELAVTGTITHGSGLPGSAGFTLSGTCAGAAATDTSATAGTCTVSSAGTASGLCALWTGRGSGSVNAQITAAGSGISYRIDYTVQVAADGAVAIQGTARNASGVKTLTGAGVAYPVTGSCNGPASYGWAGTLTIAG